jgi:hypothetical protein
VVVWLCGCDHHHMPPLRARCHSPNRAPHSHLRHTHVAHVSLQNTRDLTHTTTGAVSVILGCVLMHDLAGASYVAWLLPVLLLLGLAAVVGVFGEVAKRRVSAQHRVLHCVSHRVSVRVSVRGACSAWCMHGLRRAPAAQCG